MKLIPVVILLLAFQALPQNNSTKNLFNLKSEVKESINNFEISNPDNLISFQADRKSPGLAIIYSLLLPGMGELYADSYSSGRFFTIAEAALWATYIGVNTYGNWQKDRYKSYAESYGGVNLSGKNEDYFANISLYENIEEFNNEKALNREFDQMYNSESYNWNWTPEQRKTYRKLWVSSEEAYNNLRFVVGALIVNRIISAINAVRMVAKYNDRVESQEMGWNVSLGVEKQPTLPTTLKINFITSF